MIPASIKTGFGTEDVMPPEQERELQEKITSIMMVLMKRSLVAAATYVLHGGGTSVEAVHISKGIKLEATTFFDSDDLEEETVTMQERIFGQESDDDVSNTESVGSCCGTDSDSEVVYSDEDDLDQEKKKMLDTFIGSVEDDLGSTQGPSMDTRTDGDVCECDICSKMDAIDEIWESWDVSDDPVKFFLKEHVNNTDKLVHEQFIDV